MPTVPMKVVIATKNPGKLREIKEFLGPDFECVSFLDFEDSPDIEETGTTFLENAILKAKTCFEWSRLSVGQAGLPSVADDGGLEIDFLNGEPGIKSRRWPGYEATDEELIELALSKLHGIPWEKRTASLVSVGVFYDGKNTINVVEKIKGFITENKASRFEKGYPFRSIFWVPEFKNFTKT
ncbi:MAG: non-canonical purine NTP pyrophosphatase [Candidatus Yanofskybacteria bacterium]|nr:non-canonical purine NTP pyrophosphatase [Candidatus Yanofskybacteria bacterium]